MATIDHLFVELQLSKVNFNGLKIEVEQFFWKIVIISVCPYLKLMFSKVI